jgi:hypothetical protein
MSRGRLRARPMVLVVAAFAAIASLAPRAAAAQDPIAGARLDAASHAAISRLLDSARADGLPVDPLVSKTLEGSTKGAPPARIVAVVRTVYRALGDARAALGAGATETELVAAAAALQAGVQPPALAELRRTRGRRSVASPLVVLADLVARGVPPVAATDAVLRLARGGALDADYALLRRDVERDIAAGASPAAAAAMRASGFTGPRVEAGAPPEAP